MRRIKALLTTGATLVATAAALTVLPASAAMASASPAVSSPQCNRESVIQNMDIPTYNGNDNCYLAEYSGDTHQAAVKVLQGAMNVCFGKSVLGSYYPLVVDGNFGNNTYHALRLVQAKIRVSVDGQYGPQTRKSMLWENDNSGTPCLNDGGV